MPTFAEACPLTEKHEKVVSSGKGTKRAIGIVVVSLVVIIACAAYLWSIDRLPFLRNPLGPAQTLANERTIDELVFYPDGSVLIARRTSDDVEVWDLDTSRMIPLLDNPSEEGSWEGAIDPLPSGEDSLTYAIHDQTDLAIRVVQLDVGVRLLMCSTTTRQVDLVNSKNGFGTPNQETHENRQVASRLVVRSVEVVEGDDEADMRWTSMGREKKAEGSVAVDITPDGKHFLTFQKPNRMLVGEIKFIENPEYLQFTANEFELPETSAALSPVALLPGGERVLVADESRMLSLWNLKPSEQVHSFEDSLELTDCFALSVDGGTLFTNSAENEIVCWDVSTGKEEYRLTGHQDNVTHLAVSADGKRLLSAGDDQKLLLWILADRKILKHLVHPEVRITAVSLSDDGSKAAVAAEGGISIWDLP